MYRGYIGKGRDKHGLRFRHAGSGFGVLEDSWDLVSLYNWANNRTYD